MRYVHVSLETFTATEETCRHGTPAFLRSENLTPACGARDGRAIIPRGRGVALVPNVAVSTDAHCAECVAAVRREVSGMVRASILRVAGGR